jgi:hypothetical protein
MNLFTQHTALKLTTPGAHKTRGLFEICGKYIAVVWGGSITHLRNKSEQSIILGEEQAREKLIYVPHI